MKINYILKSQGNWKLNKKNRTATSASVQENIVRREMIWGLKKVSLIIFEEDRRLHMDV